MHVGSLRSNADSIGLYPSHNLANLTAIAYRAATAIIRAPMIPGALPPVGAAFAETSGAVLIDGAGPVDVGIGTVEPAASCETYWGWA